MTHRWATNQGFRPAGETRHRGPLFAQKPPWHSGLNGVIYVFPGFSITVVLLGGGSLCNGRKTNIQLPPHKSPRTFLIGDRGQVWEATEFLTLPPGYKKTGMGAVGQ